MKPTTSTPREHRTIGRPIKCLVLLVGLPLVLHVLLWMTQSSLGGWPAVITTLMLGIGMSIVFNHDERIESEVEGESALVGATA